MKKAILVASVLLLAACHEEPTMAFGLEYRVLGSELPAEPVHSGCTPPGAYGGLSGSSIDSWEIGEPPPHLFLEAEPDAEDDVYRIRVFIALEREEDGIWWEPSEMLAERTYDSTFGELGERDSFVVNFEEQTYTVEVQGLPPGATCP